MKPLLGVVRRAGRALLIELESGLRVETTNDYGLHKYDRVVVGYDYTESKITDVELYDPTAEAKEIIDEDPVELYDGGDEDEIAPQQTNSGDSGALCPMGEGAWDPESGLLLVEGESSVEQL